MPKKASPQPQDKYVLRLPDGMRDRIKAAAESNNRSMNAEIIATLERVYPQPLPYAIVNLEEMIVKVQKRIEDEGDDGSLGIFLTHLQNLMMMQERHKILNSGKLNAENLFRIEDDPSHFKK